MATVTAIAFNLFETIGLIQPRIGRIVREPVECAVERKPLGMQWFYDVGSTGRKVLRIHWKTDNQREGMTPSARRSN